MGKYLLTLILGISAVFSVTGHALPSNNSTPAAGDLTNLPPQLEKALNPYFKQGFHLIRWSLAPTPGVYMVELYHIDPAKVNLNRDDYRQASALGRGITLRKVIRP
ncbi:MAG: hypothetical protein KF802_00135 [Bdellovibrionaceae bacterium]|nr:hypothetical protein [Pseudobdellovibrionaceae bacterium]MBX3034778.1 hypothetical protein [Pseudobdellovibrionaceae bacterium]